MRCPESLSGRAGLEFLPDDAAQRLLKFWRLSVQVFSKRRVDQRLIASCAARLLRHFKEAVHNVLIEANRNPGLALGLAFRGKDSASLALAEVVAIFHRCPSYSSRSCGSAGRAEMIRMFSYAPGVRDDEQAARRAHTECDKSPLVRVRLIIRDGDGVRVVKHRNRFGHAHSMLAKVDSGLARLVPFKGHQFIVRTSCAYVNAKYEKGSHQGFSALADREVEMIETALAESHGRIGGPSGSGRETRDTSPDAGIEDPAAGHR